MATGNETLRKYMKADAVAQLRDRPRNYHLLIEDLVSAWSQGRPRQYQAWLSLSELQADGLVVVDGITIRLQGE